jgi:hypothetical protein
VTSDVGGQRFLQGRPGFADALIAQIGKTIVSIEVLRERSLNLEFVDRSRVSVSLKPGDYVGAEAVLFSRRDGSAVVL